MRILRQTARHYRGTLGLAVLAAIVMAGTMLWQPRLLQGVITAILSGDTAQILQLGVLLIISAVIGLVAGGVTAMASAKVSMGMGADIREQLYRHIQTFSLSNIEHFSAGNLVVRLTNDITQVQNLVVMMLLEFLRVPIIFFGALVMALVTLPQLWWIIALQIVLVFLVVFLMFGRMGRRFGVMQKLIDRINLLAKENLMGIRVVKSFNQEANEEARFEAVSDDLNQQNIAIGVLFSILIPTFMLIGNVAIVVAIYFTGQLAGTHPQAVAAIAPFTSYLMQIMFAIITGGMVVTFSARAFVSLGRIQEVLDTTPAMAFPVDEPDEELTGSVAFEHVSFTYDGAQTPSLEDISFQVKAGEMVGIVGATGSGKSTMAQLIPRLYDPQVGRVLVGGRDVKAVNEQALRRTVAYVLQQAILFSGTIRQHLQQGKASATEAEMTWANRAAQAEEFVDQLPERFEAKIEERSSNFSGGQKQRLSIARGLIGRPKVLILDDSTSALDARSEVLVQKALAHELPGTTTMVIAEKIASVIQADRILVLDQGRLVGEGTHQALLATNATYQEIYATQKGREVD